MSRIRRLKSYAQKSAEKLSRERQQQQKRVSAVEKLALERQEQENYLRNYHQGRYLQSVLAAQGAQPNNMAPSKYRDELPIIVPDVVVLQQGIDTILLNVYGSLKEDVLECLQIAKEDAQASEGDEALSPLPPYEGVTPLVYASGVKGYDYLCRSDDIQVTIRRPSKSPRPQAVIRVAAQALWRLGGGGWPAIDAAVEWLRPIFEDDYRITVGAVHLATDFQGWQPTMPDLENVVKRAADRPKLDDEILFEDEVREREELAALGYLEVNRDRKRQVTGISAGVSTNIRLNMYDKLRQSIQEHKDWVRALWEQNPAYKAREEVWRNEFQIGREWLRKHGIETLDDLRSRVASLWAYGMKWYSFRTPSATDTNRSRWEIAACWQTLSTWDGESSATLPKVKIVRPKIERMAAGFCGYLTSIMAMGEISLASDAIRWAIENIEARGGIGTVERRLTEKRQRYAGFTMGSA